MVTVTFSTPQKGNEPFLGKYGPTLGPFPYVRITCDGLRAEPKGETIAHLRHGGDWYLRDEGWYLSEGGEATGKPWSDIVIAPV